MRKRKTLNLKRVAARSVIGTPKFIANNANISLPENTLMAKEEWEQRLVDNFWGIDKDLHDRSEEQTLMAKEEILSTIMHKEINLLTQQKLWDREVLDKESLYRELDYENRVQQRIDHLKLLNSPLSVEEVLNILWNGNVENDGLGSVLSNIPSISEFDVSRMSNNPEMSQTISAPDQLNLDPMRVSLHMEGLQRSKEILDYARGQYRQVLKELKGPLLNNPSFEDTHKNTLEPLPEASNSISTLNNNTKAKTQKTALSMIQEVSKQMKLEAIEEKNTPPNPLIEGHPQYKWNQEEILHQVFLLLDSQNKGYLSKDDIGRISFDKQVHDLLKFTVFWSIIKKKEWHFIYHLFEQNDSRSQSPSQSPAPSSPASSHRSNFHPSLSATTPIPNLQRVQIAPLTRALSMKPRPKESISYNQWLDSAIFFSRETNVPVKLIRTQTEHEWLSNLKKFTSNYWDNDNQGWIRDFRTMRLLSVGDCVWTLHRKGVLWLPAVIEKINYPKHSERVELILPARLTKQSEQQATPCNFEFYTYDVWYPLNEQELNRSRLATTSKQLLTLPSQSDTIGFPPKPFMDELECCAFAFDIIDTNACGVVELSSFIEFMQSQELIRVVETSIVLSAIFKTNVLPTETNQEPSSANSKQSPNRRTQRFDPNMQMPSLLNVLIDTFSSENGISPRDKYGDPTGSISPNDCISKIDFLEFCKSIFDICKFDLHKI